MKASKEGCYVDPQKMLKQIHPEAQLINKERQKWCFFFQKIRWCVIRTEICSSSSYV